MKAIILCGEGEEGLAPLTLERPLPLLSLFDKPLLAHQAGLLRRHGVREIGVALPRLSRMVEDAMGDGEELGVRFDALYSGFVGSERQIGVLEDFLCRFRDRDTLVLVDPVMGDHGKAYRTVTEGMRRRMVELVGIADVITPNLTEACILLGENYNSLPLTRTQAKSMLARLSEKGPGEIVVTGVSLAEGSIANIGYDRENNYYWCVPCDYVPVSYPGTGDIFASVFTASLLTGDSLPMAMSRASRFVEIAIKTTFSYGGDTRLGVMLESAMPFLMQKEVPQNFHLL